MKWKFSPTRTQATYDFLKITHDGTKGEVTVTLPLGKYTITEVQAPYGFVLTQQSYTVEFGWDNQKNDIVLAKTIVSHEQDGDKECSYSIVNVKDASDAHKNGQTLVFENARVLPTPEKPGDKVSKIGVGIYKQDREALTYLPGAVYELYTVDDIYSADGTKLLDAGTKLATRSSPNQRQRLLRGLMWTCRSAANITLTLQVREAPAARTAADTALWKSPPLRVTCWTAPLWM